MQKVVLSFDYEMFLGNNTGSLCKSILEPTKKIIKVFERTGAKGVFFVDTTYLTLLKKNKHTDFLKVKSQIKLLSSLGCEIGLHLHPQWEDAVFENNKWRFKKFDLFRLHSLTVERVEQLVTEGVSVIQECCQKKPTSFRAGGWSVQPFEKFKHIFTANGIIVDSSVLPGAYLDKRPYHYYDYRMSPFLDSWRFSTLPGQEEASGEFVEFPVTTFKVPGFLLLFEFIFNKISSSASYGDGTGLMSGANRSSLFKKLFSNNIKRLTVENISWPLLITLIFLSRKRKIANYVMHPKSLSERSIRQLDYICSKYETTTYRELAF